MPQQIDRMLGEPGISLDARTQLQTGASRLQSMRSKPSTILSCCWRRRQPGPWTRRCISHSDELLLVADAAQPPAVHPIEQSCLAERPARSEAAEILLLLHPRDLTTPRNTREWLARRPVTGHVHIRLGLERDIARLARLLARKAVGLVFAGGGARGFAHLGIWRALKERGVEDRLCWRHQYRCGAGCAGRRGSAGEQSN